MKHLFIGLIFSLLIATSFAQYYFNDILANTQSNQQYTLLKQNKIKKVTVNSFDAENKQQQDFAITQEFDLYWKKMITSSKTISGATTNTTTIYENNKVKKTIELTKGVEIKNDFGYDENGKLKWINSTTTDTALKYQTIEKHIWEYNSYGYPIKMLKIKNTTDTTIIECLLDEKSNVIEERWTNKGRKLEIYYYYYNTQSKLTDIVRFNERVKKLLPDYIFEFDEQGKLIQTTQVPAGNSNYTIWKYTYNEKGLKLTEACFSKQKELLGTMQYSYEY
jgi:hypothetical protein